MHPQQPLGLRLGIYTLSTLILYKSIYTLSIPNFKIMPSKKPIIAVRTTNNIIEKFNIICQEEHRSMSNYAEKLIIDAIKSHESKHGEIKLDDIQQC